MTDRNIIGERNHMDGLVRLDKFTPSKTPYAINRDTFRVDEWGHGRVDVVWAGRKNGRTTASFGRLVHYRATTVEDLIANIDMRYGGAYEGRWDGDVLITPRPVPEPRRGGMVAGLSAALCGFPAVPEGHDGWYYRAT